MENFDLGLAYVWEYDEDFIAEIENQFQGAGLTTYKIGHHNINEVTERVKQRRLSFNFYFDRAWDVDEKFEQLGKIFHRRHTYIFNNYKNVQHAIDKASMHLEFITAGLNVPYSIIMPPHKLEKEIYISVDDLALLGRPFIIKPCNTTGGGIGVVTGAETLKEVLQERMVNKDDKYLIQEKVFPTNLNGRRAWFRCLWAFGRVIPVWWDDQTHIYSELSFEDIKNFNLKKLLYITKIIEKLTQLDFFSTEIVLTKNNRFVVIDYVNDMCDMRLKSKHPDGITDSAVKQVVFNLLRTAIKIKKTMK